MSQNNHFKVIIVDDSEEDATVLTQALDKFPCSIQWCEDGSEYIDYIVETLRTGTTSPFLVLLDINMPNVNGYECLQKMKEMGISHLPVVVLTSSASQTEFNALYNLGANACITKPDSLAGYREMAENIHGFWSKQATLPIVDMSALKSA